MPLRIFIFVCLIISASVSGKKDRIIGSITADRTDFPYQAVLKRILSDEVLCNGAIIGHIYILTTAYCVDDQHHSHANMKVVVGNTNSSSSSGNWFYPNLILIHPDYNRMVQYSSTQNDIAVVRITGYIEFDEYQRKIKLPMKDIVHNDIAVLSSWGTISFPIIRHPNLLQRTSLRIISNSECKATYPEIHDDQFCAFQSADVGLCLGDGGSPLVHEGRVIGIASLSYQCATGYPDVYTNVYYHLDFIKYVTMEHRDHIVQ